MPVNPASCKRVAPAIELIKGPKKRRKRVAAQAAQAAKTAVAWGGIGSGGSALQPISFDDDTQQSSRPTSPCRAIAAASQATKTIDFESQLRNAIPEAAIAAPIKGSEAATAATTVIAESDDEEEFDAEMSDNFEGINWTRLKKYCKPLRTQKRTKSWVYKWGYRVALLKDMSRIYWICRDCHQRKVLDITGEGAAETTSATSSTAKHLLTKHRITKAGVVPRTLRNGQQSLAMLAGNGVVVSQETANAVGNFDIQAFRLAAVTWLVDNNIPLSQFEQPAFWSMIQFANPEAELALWTSHHSVSRFVMRLYDHMKPQVVELINSAISKIHISFDGWTTKGGKRSFFGIVAHFVDNKGSIKDVAIDLPQLSGAHSGNRIAVCVEKTLQSFGITGPKLGYFVLNNASNNDTAVAALGLKYGFVAAHRRLRCGAHTINLVGQAVIFGSNKAAYPSVAPAMSNQPLWSELHSSDDRSLIRGCLSDANMIVFLGATNI
jgi:hypothetical protein